MGKHTKKFTKKKLSIFSKFKIFNLSYDEICFYGRIVFLTLYFVNLIPIFLIIYFFCRKYDFDSIIILNIFLMVCCVYLRCYEFYRKYLDFDE